MADRNGVRIETENSGEKWGTDRNGELRRETVMPETVVKDRNVDGGDGVRNGVNWKGRSMMECGGKAWNVMEGPGMVPEGTE